MDSTFIESINCAHKHGKVVLFIDSKNESNRRNCCFFFWINHKIFHTKIK